MECPKCGRGVEVGAFICPGCDYILDASFLGDDITDDEREKRPAQRPARADRNVDFGEDAMILGDVNEMAGEVSSFQTRDAGVSQREATQARFYIGGAVAQLMNADAIPEIAEGASGQSMRITPFERHVLGFVNGKRSVGRIEKKAAMEETEFKTALALLADKGFIRLKGYKKQKAPAPSLSTSSSSSSSSSSPRKQAEAKLPSRQPLAGERTMVASMEHIEALALANKRPTAPKLAVSEAQQTVVAESPLKSLKSKRAPAPKPSVDDEEFEPTDQRVPDLTRRVSSQASKPARSLSDAARAAARDDASSRFASLQAEEPEPAADDWGKNENQSSVFADSGTRERPTPPPPSRGSVVDAEDAEAAPADDVALPPGFDAHDEPTRGRASLESRLRDPTGMGDAFDDLDAGAGGAPVNDGDADDNGDADGDGDDDDHEFIATDDVVEDPVSAGNDARPAAVDAVALFGDDDGAALNDGFDSPLLSADDRDPSPTSEVSIRPMTLPSEALMPIVEEPPPAPVVPPAPPPRAPTPAPMAALPGMGLPGMGLPGQAVARPATPAPAPPSPPPAPPAPPPPAPPASVSPAATAPAVAKPMALPGQPLGAPAKPMGLPGQPLGLPGQAVAVGAPAVRPPAAPRPSAASTVPFEQRKKAERIFDQALKDQAEGRTASALMNAKLATNFDPSVPAYKELVDQLSAAPKGPAAKGAQPRELQLFEQASEAEGRGDYERAAKLLREALTIKPDAAALHNRLGVVLAIRLKKHEEALNHLKRAIELEPGSIVYMNNFSKVTGLLESMLEKDPKAKKKGLDGGGKVDVRKVRPMKF